MLVSDAMFSLLYYISMGRVWKEKMDFDQMLVSDAMFSLLYYISMGRV